MRLNLSKTGKIAALLVGTAFAATLASTAARAEITGTLTCNIAAGTGIIVVSQRNVSCTYHSAVGPTEFYTGSISRLGVDIGTLDSGILTYNVIEGGTPAPGALAGNYFGPGVGITLGTGAGLNALVGGNANSISLQPIAAQTSTGVNINAGIGNLNLNFAGVEAPHRRHHRMHRHHHHM
jgi:hypothetical protein